jgi:hypothetical protein
MRLPLLVVDVKDEQGHRVHRALGANACRLGRSVGTGPREEKSILIKLPLNFFS